MITLTPAAAWQIRRAAEVSFGDPVHLRLAAKVLGDGEVEFGMGFDDPRTGDLEVTVEGITLLIAKPSQELMKDVLIDFREVEPGDSRFVFARAESQ